MLPRRLTLLALACAALFAVAGCGGSDSEEPASSATPEAAATPEATKPVVTVPKGKAPKKLVIKDLKVGDGATAEPGKQVTVQYVGVSKLNG
ncbi:MAG TPA: hypothetical protein VFN44_24105, partial [Solirubrobacteraceae bacterium]|nr:hypothetical protein [Solirubrobacteraceae bacterium]